MKVIHIHTQYLPAHGGSSIRISKILEAGKKYSNFEQHIIVINTNFSKKIPNEEIINGIFVYRVPSWFWIPYKLIQLHKKHRFDIIHIHNPRPFWFSWPFIKGIPIIFELHSLQPLSFLKKLFTKIAYNISDSIIVLSKTAKKWLVKTEKLSPDKILVLPNGIDLDLFSNNCDHHIKLPVNSKKNIGYIGSFYYWQGLFELVESMPYVLEKEPDTQLILIGDGPLKKDIDNRIDDLGIRSKVFCLSYVNRKDIPSYLKSLDLFTMLRPKTQATELVTPLKIFEVGLAKVPLLISNRPGLLEAGGNNAKDYFFIQKNLSPKAVAKKIVMILSEDMIEKRREMSEQYYQYLIKYGHTWENIADIQHDLYVKLLYN